MAVRMGVKMAVRMAALMVYPLAERTADLWAASLVGLMVERTAGKMAVP